MHEVLKVYSLRQCPYSHTISIGQSTEKGKWMLVPRNINCINCIVYIWLVPLSSRAQHIWLLSTLLITQSVLESLDLRSNRRMFLAQLATVVPQSHGLAVGRPATSIYNKECVGVFLDKSLLYKISWLAEVCCNPSGPWSHP